MSDSEIVWLLRSLVFVFGCAMIGAAVDEIFGLPWAFASVLAVTGFFYKFIWTASDPVA